MAGLHGPPQCEPNPRGPVICGMRLIYLGLAMFGVSGALAAQSAPPATADAQFEVASIRRNVSADTGAQVAIKPGGQLTVTNNTLFNIVRNAYGVQPFQIVPGERMPDWFNQDRWDIVAKAPADAAPQPGSEMMMLQALLADRFKLVVRRETREMPVYALVLARTDGRLGPQLRTSNGDCEAARLAREKGGPQPPIGRGFCGTRAGNGSVSTSGVPIAAFARNLAPMTGRFVIDRTGLTGSYDLDVKWTPDQGLAAGAAPGAATDGTSLFAALEEQIGLKLEPQRAPIDVLVIESAERPRE